MYRLLIFIFFCYFLTISGASQKNSGFFYVTGKIKVDQGVVDGTIIAIYRNNLLFQEIDVNRTGSFRIPVQLGHIFRFDFNNPLYYSKSIEINTQVPTEVLNEESQFPPYQLSLMLYRKVPGVSETSGKIGKISYNPKIDNFDAELIRQETDLKKLIDEALKNVRAKSMQYDEQNRKAKKQKYDQYIADADYFFRVRKYEEAMKKYREAVMVFPSQAYPRDKVDEAFQVLVLEQLIQILGPPVGENLLKYLNYGDTQFAQREYTYAQVTYSQAFKIRPDDVNLKKKVEDSRAETLKLRELALNEARHKEEVYAIRTVRYKELIGKGDSKFRQEDIAGAKDFYAQAATQIDENSYALLMLQTIGDILSNDEIALKLAKERDEAEKKRLMGARNQAYADAIKEADELFNRRIFREALGFYELALSVKSYEMYPGQQIKKINDILAKMQINGAEYSRLLREGEALIYNKEYISARICYVKAHELIPDERFALQKISEIDQLLAKLKEQDSLQEQYEREVALADRLFSEKKYNESITSYQKALTLKPPENYPREQIQKIRGILSRESEEQKRLMQQQSDFELAILNADDAFNRKSYAPARSLYLKALQIIPGQEYPSAQIRKIDAILAEDRDSKKSVLETIDFTNLGNLTEDIRKNAYDEAMSLGESFYRSKDWGLARFYFRRALSLYPNDSEAGQKLRLTELKMGGADSNEAKYREMIQKAEESFETGDFSVSKFYYSKALEVKPGDSHVMERINVVDKLMQNTSARINIKEYEDAMQKGTEAFVDTNYSLARFYYRKALSIKPDDEHARKSLGNVDKALIISKQASDQYGFENNKKLADTAFEQKQYSLALNYYRKALTFKTDDTYILKQIQKVDEMIRQR